MGRQRRLLLTTTRRPAKNAAQNVSNIYGRQKRLKWWAEEELQTRPEKHGARGPLQGPRRMDKMHVVVKLQSPALHGDPVICIY